MSKQYIEIDSTYRNRNGFKNPSEFEIDFNTPMTEPHLSIDPVSDQAPIIEWDFTSSNSNSYIDDKTVSVTQTSSDNLTLDIEHVIANNHILSDKDDYYNTVVVVFGTESRRIVKYKYLSTDPNTNTVKAQITLDYPFSTTPNTIDFKDPNIISTIPAYIFVPGGGIYDNTYVGYYLYKDENTYYEIKDYDSVTRRVTVDGNFGSSLPSKLSIRKSLPSHTITLSSGTTIDGYISSGILIDNNNNVTANRYLNFIRDTTGKYYKIISFNKDTHTITGESNSSTTELSFTNPVETPSIGDKITYNGQTRKVESVSGSGTITVTLDKGFTSTVRLYTVGNTVTLLDGTIGTNDELTYDGETRNVTIGPTTINTSFTTDIPRYQPVDFRSEEKTVYVTTTGNNLFLSNGGDVYKTFMIGSKVVYKSQTREIISFTSSTNATLDSPFSDDLSNEKVNLPSVYKKLNVITSGNTLTLDNGDSRDVLTVDGTITYRGTTRKITLFSTTTSVTTADLNYQFPSDIEGVYVTKTDANIPSNTDFTLVQKSNINNITYNSIDNSSNSNTISAVSSATLEILSTTYDNNSSLQYTGSIVSQSQLVCHEIELLHIILPNKVLKHHRGGRVSRHPYIYVELSNVSSGQNRHNIYSNNPHAVKALFKCSIRDVSYPVQSPYVKLDGGGMIQTIKFKPTDRLYFRVILSDGTLFKVEDEETFNPLPPNPSIQLNAMFSIKRV